VAVVTVVTVTAQIQMIYGMDIPYTQVVTEEMLVDHHTVAVVAEDLASTRVLIIAMQVGTTVVTVVAQVVQVTVYLVVVAVAVTVEQVAQALQDKL